LCHIVFDTFPRTFPQPHCYRRHFPNSRVSNSFALLALLVKSELTMSITLALASQSLSVVSELIPYVRETFRRHLNQAEAVLLVDFDKLKRVSDLLAEAVLCPSFSSFCWAILCHSRDITECSVAPAD
jgi:hypothetical protein